MVAENKKAIKRQIALKNDIFSPLFSSMTLILYAFLPGVCPNFAIKIAYISPYILTPINGAS